MRRIISLLTAFLILLMPVSGLCEEASKSEKNAALRLLSALYEGQNTLVFSPFSLNAALAMAAEGADGDTLTQLNAFLGHPLPDRMILEDLSLSGVHIANAAFLRPDFPILDEYQEALEDSHEAESCPMETGNVMQQVNDWVSEHTSSLIDSMLDQEPGPETTMLLLNALSMRAEWTSPFDPSATAASVFHAPDGDIEVSSMNQTSSFLYSEVEGVQSVALPYRNSVLEMVVVLPERGQFETLIEELSAAPDLFLKKYAPSENTLVQLSLPVIEAESSFELKEALLEAGVTDAFDPDKADFSRMSENALDMDLHIGSVLQKTVLKVDETGTEAAAATQVAMLARGSYVGKTAVMTVDRPFMLLIHDPASGYVLFAACISNPA